MKYQLLQIDVEQSQKGKLGSEDLKVRTLSLSLQYKSTQFIYCFNWIKLSFSALSLYMLFKFHKRMKQFKWKDLGLVQKMLYGLMINLVFFNDPLCLA